MLQTEQKEKQLVNLQDGFFTDWASVPYVISEETEGTKCPGNIFFESGKCSRAELMRCEDCPNYRK